MTLPTIETARLLLRPRTAADLDACLAIDSDPEVMRYVGGPPEDPARHAESVRRRIAARYPTGLGYGSLAARSDPQQILGWVALVPLEESVHGGDIEIGWRIARSAWGNGYASEAAAALLDHATAALGCRRIVATIHPDNAGSVRVAEKIGMAFSGPGTYDGQPSLVYAGP